MLLKNKQLHEDYEDVNYDEEINETVSTVKSKSSARIKGKNWRAMSICLLILSMFILIMMLTYLFGRIKYNESFLPNTFVNGIDVGGKTCYQVNEILTKSDNKLEIRKQDAELITIPFSDFDCEYNNTIEIAKLFDKQNRNMWFASLLSNSETNFDIQISYNKEKLINIIKSTDWGDKKNQDAEIYLEDDKYKIKPEVQGDEMNFDVLEEYIINCLNSENFKINAADSKCYIPPEITAAGLSEKLENLNKYSKIEINYDFDYTTETLTGEDLSNLVKLKEDGSVTANKKKCEEYIDELAEKYDTYNTERKFKATMQGNITIPTGSDARYGWWIDKDKMCEQLIEMIESGDSFEKVEPIYYKDGEFDYIGLKSARSENDDIGNTYVEIDLTNQKLWYYKDGKLELECSIVSGQTTSQARTTEAGVYRVWFKATNYRMKSSNSDGETWDSNCDYWTSVSPVGIGLHDSQWRSSFGGNIFRTNGSHGCINMTLDGAKYIYDNVEYNTPVVMYY